jgi:hypothetical protein
MRIGILSCKIGVDLFVVRTRCVSEIHLAEVPLKAFPRHLLFGCGALRHRALPRVYTAILVFYGGGSQWAGDVPATSAWRWMMV